jgi:hypothetical protein
LVAFAGGRKEGRERVALILRIFGSATRHGRVLNTGPLGRAVVRAHARTRIGLTSGYAGARGCGCRAFQDAELVTAKSSAYCRYLLAPRRLRGAVEVIGALRGAEAAVDTLNAFIRLLRGARAIEGIFILRCAGICQGWLH